MIVNLAEKVQIMYHVTRRMVKVFFCNGVFWGEVNEGTERINERNKGVGDKGTKEIKRQDLQIKRRRK
jgi:hypothetical protein